MKQMGKMMMKDVVKKKKDSGPKKKMNQMVQSMGKRKYNEEYC